MAGPGGAATVVIAQPDDAARELLARIVESAGHIAVRLDASAPPDVVEATVEASANLLIIDLASVSRVELTAVIEALAVRRFPAQVVALADGPASGELAVTAGAAQFLARPFHQRDLTALLTALLDPNHANVVDATDAAGAAGAVAPDAEASLLSAIDRLPPIDELPDLPGTAERTADASHEPVSGGAGDADDGDVVCAVAPLDAVHLADDDEEDDEPERVGVGPTDHQTSAVEETTSAFDHTEAADESAEPDDDREPDPRATDADADADETALEAGADSDATEPTGSEPERPDDSDAADATAEPVSRTSADRSTGLGDTFTDILKMGRKV